MLITCTRARRALIRRFHPALRRSRGLVALVRLGGSSFIARGGNGRPCVLNVLANLCDDVRANCDIPAILQALGALGCASSLEYLFETLRDHSHPVTLVFERSGTGILLHAAEAGGGECSACSNPATDSPVPLVLTIKLNGPMLAERTTLSMLPTITWEQGTSCSHSQRCRACQGTAQRAAHAQPLSYGRG